MSVKSSARCAPPRYIEHTSATPIHRYTKRAGNFLSPLFSPPAIIGLSIYLSIFLARYPSVSLHLSFYEPFGPFSLQQSSKLIEKRAQYLRWSRKALTCLLPTRLRARATAAAVRVVFTYITVYKLSALSPQHFLFLFAFSARQHTRRPLARIYILYIISV